MTKSEVKAKLDEYGVEYPADATKSELIEMLTEYEESIPKESQPDNEEITEEVIEEEKVIEEEVVTKDNIVIAGRQATPVECMRQLLGKKPFVNED